MQHCLRSWAPLPCVRFRAIAPPGHPRTNVRARPENAIHRRLFATEKYDATNELFDLIASNEPSASDRINSDGSCVSDQQPSRARPLQRRDSRQNEQPVDHGRVRPFFNRSLKRTLLEQRLRTGVDHNDQTLPHGMARPKLGWNSAHKDEPRTDLSAMWSKTSTELTEHLRNGTQFEPQDLAIDGRAAHWVDIFLSKVPGETLWTHSALWLLAYDPDRLVDFLLATHTPPHPPAKLVSSALENLVQYYAVKSEDVAAEQCPRLVKALATLAVRDDGEPLSLLASHTPLLFQYLSGDEIKELFDTIKRNKIAVNSAMLLSFSTHLAKHGDIKRSIAAYLQAHHVEEGRPVDESRQTCTFLLRSAMNHPDGLQECLQLCSELGELGFQPDTQMANVLVLNAVEAGQVTTAMHMYEALFGQDLQPNEYTLGILLKAYRQDASAAMPFDALVSVARASGALWTNCRVATEIVISSIKRVMEQNPDSAWYESWQLFDEVFDTSPLLQLGLPPPQGFEKQTGSHDVQQPELPAIRAMLDLYLQLQRHHGKNSSAALSLWKQFQALVSAGDPTFLELARTDHCYNVLLYALIWNQHTMLTATEVIKDMQTALPESFGVKKCTPTDITWNIFLYGFRRHSLEKLAEQVLQHMQDEGIKPSQIAWEQLANGYAQNQDLDGFMSVLRRADQSGAVWTAWMDQAVGQFKDQHRLQQAMIEERMNQPSDFTSDLKDGLVARLESTDDPAVR